VEYLVVEADPRIPSSDICVLRYVLDRHARERPAQTFVRFEDGSEWTYSELHTLVRRTAAAVQEIGVRQGEHVVVWLPNGPEALRVFLALGYMGAVYVPINTAYRGPLLSHVLTNSGASLLVADPASGCSARRHLCSGNPNCCDGWTWRIRDKSQHPCPSRP
jgi:crotonobetaine/carnitine-CoA ligase